MKRTILTVAICLFALAAAYTAAAQPNCTLKPSETILLYPEGQNVDKGTDGALGPLVSNGHTAPEETSSWGGITNIGDNARIDLYLPESPNGQMIIICPGGGYWDVSSYNEGIYVADWMVERGITAAVVKYRLPNGHWEIPLRDVQNAFRYCRHHAADWGINQIGIIGFSAGGHLAASASTLFVDEVTRPDFSVLIYPVISFEEGITHMGSRKNLLGPDENNPELIERFSLEKQVTPQTPPTFIAHSSDDSVVPVENSTNYYLQLVKHKVPAEMHMYPTGEHGWGFSSEKFIGKGRGRFVYARAEFDASLERWLTSLRKK